MSHPVRGLRTAPSVGKAEQTGEFHVAAAESPLPICTEVGPPTPGQKPKVTQSSPGIPRRARVQVHRIWGAVPRINRVWQVWAELSQISDELDYPAMYYENKCPHTNRRFP